MTIGFYTRRAIASLVALVCFDLILSAAEAANFRVIHTFASGSARGWSPSGDLIADSNGVIYGTTQFGGKSCPTTQYSCGGIVYSLTPPAAAGGPWTETVLYGFKGGSDGAAPAAGVILRPDNGLIHGTTKYGGGSSCAAEPHGWGCGTVFELAPPGAGQSRWTHRILHRFVGEPDGQVPDTRMLQLRNGTYYGSTSSGGKFGGGQTFRILPNAQQAAQHALAGDPYSALYNFFNSNDGGNPVSLADLFDIASFYNLNLPSQRDKSRAVASASSAPLFGFAKFDGDDNCRCGTVFRLNPPDETHSEWTLQVLHEFLGGMRGAFPNDGGVIGPDFYLYGTAAGGNSCPSVSSLGCGVVFRVSLTSRKYEVLYRFKGGQDGAAPIGHLAIDSAGNVYGATRNGGSCSFDTRGCGTVYKLSPPGAPGLWTRTILHVFQASADGKWPTSGVLNRRGVLYGTTDTAVYAQQHG
jgi:hypothetical protein